MGNHSRGRRNINGNALADFLEVHRLFICNTAFQHSARHKTTWQGQRRDAATGQVVPIYNVIDFVICRQTHKRLLVDSRTYAGTLLDSDHRLLTAKVDLKVPRRSLGGVTRNQHERLSQRKMEFGGKYREGGCGIYHRSDCSDRTTRYTTLPRNGCNVSRTKKIKTLATEHP